MSVLVFQKHVVRTKFDMDVFIMKMKTFGNLLKKWITILLSKKKKNLKARFRFPYFTT